MAWNTGRSKQLPPNWRRGIRPRILARDPICTDPEGCNQPSTEVHHLGQGNDHRDHMLAGLCAAHHLRETQRDARAAQARKPKLTRTPEPHPGLR